MNLKLLFYLNIITVGISCFASNNSKVGEVLTLSALDLLDPMAPLFDSANFGVAHKPEPVIKISKAKTVPRTDLDEQEFAQVIVGSLRLSMNNSGLLGQIDVLLAHEKVRNIKIFLISFLTEYQRQYQQPANKAGNDERDNALEEIFALSKEQALRQPNEQAIKLLLKSLKETYFQVAGLQEILNRWSYKDPQTFVDSLDNETLLAISDEKNKKPAIIEQYVCMLS